MPRRAPCLPAHRNIQRTEWQNLLDFFAAKKLRIDNLASAQRGPGAGPSTFELGDDEDDPGAAHASCAATGQRDAWCP